MQVSLANKQAEVEYNKDLISLEQIKDAIEDLGFEASIVFGVVMTPKKVEDQDQFTEVSLNLQRSAVQVHGMHCNSCVRKIEGSLGERNGIQQVTVSLVEKCAFVVHDPDVIPVREIGVAVQKLGFEAILPDGESLKPEKSENIPLVKIKPPPTETSTNGSISGSRSKSSSKSLNERKLLMPAAGNIYQKKKEKYSKVDPVKSEQVKFCH